MKPTASEKVLGFRPLYLQVKESLIRRLIEGTWKPGQLIPSEMELAREIGVSQGTIRKALDAMTAENLLVRQQGRGTFVAEPEESRILFQFFRLAPDSGERCFPQSRVLRHVPASALPDEAAVLGLDEGAPVCRIERLRMFDTTPLMVETITLPASRFPGFDLLGEIPNNVYRLYSDRWGITIGSATERLKAIAASPEDAAILGCARGTPLLQISRRAFDLEQQVVEYRVSRCLTDQAHYAAEMR